MYDVILNSQHNQSRPWEATQHSYKFIVSPVFLSSLSVSLSFRERPWSIACFKMQANWATWYSIIPFLLLLIKGRNEQWINNKRLNYRHVNRWVNQSWRAGENQGLASLGWCSDTRGSPWVFQSFIPFLQSCLHQPPSPELITRCSLLLDMSFLFWNVSLLLSNHLTPAPFFKTFLPQNLLFVQNHCA